MNKRPSARSQIPYPLRPLVRRVTRMMAVGKNVTVGKESRIGRSVSLFAGHGLTIGNRVSIGPGSIVQVDGTIGDYTLIGQGVQIVGRTDHAMDEVGVPIVDGKWVGDREQKDSDVIHIGRDVWVGGGSIILSGLSVGDAAVIGAGSVVTRDVPPGAVVAGNPANFLRWRFASGDDLRRHLEILA